MQNKTQKAIILEEYGKQPIYKENQPIPDLKDGELLIKVEASTINPSDRLFLQGYYLRRPPLPAVCGIQGTGVVVEAKGENLQTWIGKRVTFLTNEGSWSEYAKAAVSNTIQIDKDVPLGSAASGLVNPLTVVGMVENYKKLSGKGGIIHSAAASALGRQLNQLCQKENIPLLNIVRRQQQAEILRKEGAKNVIVTEGDWVSKYKEYVKEGFGFIYDPLGGGPVTQALITNLSPRSFYHIYGTLENKPFILTSPSALFLGVTLTGFNLYSWWGSASEQTKIRVRKQHSQLLKKQLSTKTYKEYQFKNINQAIEISSKVANEGKVLLKFT